MMAVVDPGPAVFDDSETGPRLTQSVADRCALAAPAIGRPGANREYITIDRSVG